MFRGGRRWSVRRFLLAGAILFLLLFYYKIYSGRPHRPKLKRDLVPHSFCDASLDNQPEDDLSYWGSRARGPSSQPRVLVISSPARAGGRTSTLRDITDLLASVRVKYKVVGAGKKLPDLSHPAKGVAKYLVVVFQDVRDYHSLEAGPRAVLDSHCRHFKVGILAFVPAARDKMTEEEVMDNVGTNRSSSIRATSHLTLTSAVTSDHALLRILKQNLTITSPRPAPGWVRLECAGPGCVPVISAGFSDGSRGPVVVEDPGTEDGVLKVLVGGGHTLHSWFMKLAVLDALHHLSRGEVSLPLTRYLMVDIDDIFVGVARLLTSDVSALVDSQREMQRLVTGFQYNLGFSGKYYKAGTEEEGAADEALVAAAANFWWFPHMWKHIQPHRFDNVSELLHRMQLNKKFAESHHLPLHNRYAVAPHHSGVFPVHEQLYSAWRRVWDVAFTSTEEYPNLRPARKRRGFVHADIHVLPRQTCGLFTKNLHYDDYPGGPGKLEDSIQGGELFQTIVTNPVSIFMTHMPNYCCDRLAPYTFQSVFSFVRCHTNLHLMTHPPSHIAATYFSLFPEETQAVWSNPCEDKRHLEIWSESKTCQKLPQFLVVGPQKTGTTALFSFLQLHPGLVSSLPSPDTFEEVQFFSGRNYQKGLDWYMDFFPSVNSSVALFEKSATYFDGDQVPLRAARLLPDASIVAVLVSPGARAYSWYQHQRAHGDTTALEHSFREVITATAESPRPLQSLQSRCLEPGKYAAHLERWLAHYPASRLVIVDGEQLRGDPVSAMAGLQHRLHLSPVLDYSRSLYFDKAKGFYCMKIEGRRKCLGKGKGRVYPPMDEASSKWLLKFYRKHNENLVRLLSKLGYNTPQWLAKELEEL